MKVTLVQMDSTGTRQENEQKAIYFMKQAVLEKTDIICLSESFVYWGKEYEQRCCTLKDIEKYQNFAKENNVNILLGSINLLDENANKTTNTCFVINREGSIVHRYDKKYMYQVKKENLIVDESQRTIPRKNKWIICYTVKDRLDTKVMSGIEASTFNILQQLSTTFMIFAGLIFFKEEFILAKFIGAMLIIFSNVLVFYQKGKFEFNKYVLLGIISNLVFTVALFLDVNISQHFNLPMYAAITLTIPAILIMIFERIKLSEIKSEFTNGNKRAILITAISWPITIITQLRAYQLGNVTIVAPLCALSVMLNVMIGYLFLKEKDNLLRKIISAILIIISIILIKI